MADDGVARRWIDRASLDTLDRVTDGVLIGALGNRQSFEPNRQPSVVHHREHRPHAGVRFTDHVPDRAIAAVAVRHDAGWTGPDTHLVFDADTAHVIAFPDRAGVVDQKLRNDEQRHAFGADRCVRDSCQHQVHDVVGHVVLAVGDEDLLAEDSPGAIGRRHSLGGERADIAPGLWFGEVHGAAPLAGHHSFQVDLALAFAAVVQHSVDGALRQEWTQREPHVGAGQDLLHCDRHQPRERSAAVLDRERNGAPTGINVFAVRIDESGWGANRECRRVVGRVLTVTDSVERSELGLDESAELGQQIADC